MALLAEALPHVGQTRFWLSRDQWFLLLAALNQVFIALDAYLAHSISGALKPNEWIPVVFGVIAGVGLLASGWVARRNRPLASALATIILVFSVAVGLLGVAFHLNRTALDSGLVSLEAVTSLIWAPPVVGPLFFVLIGVLGISAAWVEAPPDSGALTLIGSRKVQMPYSKTRAYMLITAIFIIATLIGSVLDHARIRFEDPWVWLPVSAGLFGFATCMFLGAIKTPSRGDIVVHLTAMLMLLLVGVIGLLLHAEASLTAEGRIVLERFLRGSPLMAPLLFCNVGLMGLLALLDPAEA